jgi:tRNA (cytidine/uridine-2'-O-)-methyltransferase
VPFNVVLYQPENPHNTGAIARTCALVGAALHLVGPYGFTGLDDVARSSMSYLGTGPFFEHLDWASFRGSLPPSAQLVALWDEGATSYDRVDWNHDDYLVFGRESVGLPAEVLESCKTVQIPMPGVASLQRRDHRDHSFNLSVSVAMTLAVATSKVRGG